MLLYYILIPFAWLLWHIGFRIRVEGRENLKKVQTQGYILAPTHVSAIDPVFIVITRWGRRMAGIQHRDAGGEIDHLIPFNIPQRSVLRFLNKVAAHHPYAARSRLLATLIQF